MLIGQLYKWRQASIKVSDGSIQKNRVELKANYQKGDVMVAIDDKAIES